MRFLANENIVNGMESNAWSHDPAHSDWTNTPNSENNRSHVAITPESPGYNTDNWGYPKGGNLRAKVDNPSANFAKGENVRINNPRFNNAREANSRAANLVDENPRLANEWPVNDRLQVKSPDSGRVQDTRTNNVRNVRPHEKVDNSWVNEAQLETYERHSPTALEDLG